MQQRGRKGAAQRQISGLARQVLEANQPLHFPVPAPKTFAEPERRVWDEVMRTRELDHIGQLLLEQALRCLAHAREFRKVIDHDGAVLVDRNGMPRRHPLLGTELRARSLARSFFKMLRLEFD